MFPFWQRTFAQYDWVKQALEILALIFAAGIVGACLRRLLRIWTKRFGTMVHHSLIALLDRVIMPVLLLGVITISLRLFPLSPKATAVMNRVLYLGVLGIVLYYSVKVAQLFVKRWLEGAPERRSLQEPVQFLSNVVFATLAIMILLENTGVSLKAVWTTLGVGGVAIALALQDTLSNFFAGVYLRLDNPVGLDDYIKLEGGEEGFVIQRGWRSTRIRTLQNNIVVVPNAKLASTIVTNYSLPEPEMALLIRVAVSYDSDPDRVERILVDEAKRAAAEVPGLLSEPEPFVRLIPGFGNSTLDFTLISHVKSFTDQYLVQHELRKRILHRFAEEGIEMPLPQQEVHVHLSDNQGSGSSATQAMAARAAKIF